MCGISGIATNGARHYDHAMDSMVQALHHRGPDGNGVVFFDNCALGHNRLSIVDLNTGGQPMYSASGKQCLVFNGEIYGYQAIRDSLRDSYPFFTTSDTEVILALYAAQGADFVKQLPGMFAFALWDEAKQVLVCARDRFGEKPFYYAIGERGEFIFASEIKAILATGLVRPVLDVRSVVHYLRHLYVHPHRTIYENIHTLPPAHRLMFSNGAVSVERYWEQPVTDHSIGLSDAVPEFRRLFDRAVQQQLIADVPVGAFLSGGLDSSTVVAVASRHAGHIKTFSFGFEDSLNELPFAREVAKKYNTDHRELFDTTDIAELLVTMQDVYDEPFADSSNIPTYLIAKLAREHIKVVLTGDGGDELLGGYGWYRSYPHMATGRQLPDVHAVHMLLKALARAGMPHGADLVHRYRAMADQRSYGSVVGAHQRKNTYFTDRELGALGLGELAAAPHFVPTWRPSNTVDDAMRMDLETYMPGDILVKVDRASMANGIELRAPFLDVDLASFCIALPYRLKITRDIDKYILREAFAADWPPSVRNRSKQGFGAPVGRWLRRDSMRALKERYLNDPAKPIFKIISFSGSRSIVRKDNYQTWTLLVLSLWMENHPFELSGSFS